MSSSRTPIPFERILFYLIILLTFAGAAVMWYRIRGPASYISTVSSANQLWMACVSYANRHDDSFPNSLRNLLDENYLDKSSFDHLVIIKKDELNDAVNGSWNYFGGGKKLNENDFLLAELRDTLWNPGTSSHQILRIHSKRGVLIDAVPIDMGEENRIYIKNSGNP